MHILSSRVRYAAIFILCAAFAAACDSSSPVVVDSVPELAGNGAGAASGALEISPVEIDFDSTGTSASLVLTNTSRRPISWTASEGASWLLIGATSGSLAPFSSGPVALTADRDGLTEGTHTTSITFVSSGTPDVVSVSITVPSTAPPLQLTVSPTQIDFGTTGTSATITLTNNSSIPLPWTATETANWLSLSVQSGTIAAQSSKTVSLSANRSGKAVGTYTTSVLFSAGTAGPVSVPVSMTVPSTGPVLLTGQLIDQFDGHPLAGLTVDYEGKTATTDGTGRFTIAGSPTSSLNTLTLTGPGVYQRVTYAKTGDSSWRVVPASFDMNAFDDVARDEFGPSTVRWVANPTIYIDTDPEGFTSAELSTWINEVKVQAAEFISKWTGATMSPAAVIVTSNPPNDMTAGTIVIHFSENSADYGGSASTIGWATLSYASSGQINSSAVWLRYLGYSGTGGANKRKGILGHELGHATGRGHMSPTTTPSLMYASIGSNTDLKDFDVLEASFHYTRSPDNSAPDTDSENSFLGNLAPSAAPMTRKWLCEAGEGLPRP